MKICNILFVLSSMVSFIVLDHGLAAEKSVEKSRINSSNKVKIRMLNWWSYLDKRVSEKLSKSGFNLDVSIYQSNEVALARLLSKREEFDVAIVSNINLPILLSEKIFNTKLLNEVIAKRNYLKMILSGNECVPYLWGTTLYAYDSRIKSIAPKTLAALLEMKKSGFKIGILDDPFEVTARIIGDNLDQCKNKNYKDIFSHLKTCNKSTLTDSKLKFAASDFMTSTDEFMLNEQVAAYSWQGSVFMNLKSAPWIKFNLSDSHPIIGADYVCIINKSGKSAEMNIKIKKFVELLTDSESTKWNVESSQYFSPFVSETDGLHPRVIEFYNELIKISEKSEPIFIKAPDQDDHAIINKWWKAIRYEVK